jgi:hypothetical protein
MSDDKKEPPKVGVVIVGTGAGNMRTLAALAGGPVEHSTPEQVPKEPDIAGKHGKAWRIDLVKSMARYGFNANDAGEQGTVAAWVIEAAWAHPLWHSYIINLVHLRPTRHCPTPGVQYFPGATHEFRVYALSPDHPRIATIIGDANPAFLEPANFCAQLKQSTDDGAIAVMEKAVQDICSGELNPDTDAVTQWRERFGSHGIKKEFR